MNEFRTNVIMLIRGILSFCKDWLIISKGQSIQSEILQISHRLEKGLTRTNPKKMYGWEKATRLMYLLDRCPEGCESRTGYSVLSQYLKSKKASDYAEDKVKCEDFINANGKNGELIVEDNNWGGALLFKKLALSNDDYKIFTQIVKSRHSIRNFNHAPVSIEKLKAAIDLALQCPSACNRQPFKVYILSNKAKSQMIGASEYNADQWLYITGEMDAFHVTEFNDWIVSASIFAGYLSLTLHAVGLGACIMRKDLVVESDYNRSVKKVCHIPNTEKIILEFAVGNYDDDFIAPVSKRKNVDDIIDIIA
jgi:hypothetical protein